MPWVWAHASMRGGGNGVERATEGGGANQSGSTTSEVRGDSPSGAQFCD
jgi:hypothetical protein